METARIDGSQLAERLRRNELTAVVDVRPRKLRDPEIRGAHVTSLDALEKIVRKAHAASASAAEQGISTYMPIPLTHLHNAFGWYPSAGELTVTVGADEDDAQKASELLAELMVNNVAVATGDPSEWVSLFGVARPQRRGWRRWLPW